MNVGGPAVLLADVASGLESQGFQHTIITGRCLSNEVDYLELHPKNINIIRLNKISRSVFLIDDILGFVELLRVLRKLDPDIVHTHTSKAGVLGRFASRMGTPRAKVIHTFHGHLLYGYFSQWKLNLIVLIEKILAKLSDVLIAVSNPVKNDLISAGIGKKIRWEVIHPAVRVSQSTFKRDNTAHKPFRLLWIGRFADVKDPILAIEAFAKLPEMIRKNIEFTIVGDGDLLESTRNEAMRLGLTITFTGWHSSPIELLEKCDLLLMTSKNEGLPVGMLEAASVGVPTLSTNVGGVGDFIADGETGWLVENDARKIAINLERIFRDPEALKRVGAKARERIIEEFSIESYVKKHIALYRKLGSK
jgi:glycosyltransferase involved in cell wall biosynthesis